MFNTSPNPAASSSSLFFLLPAVVVSWQAVCGAGVGRRRRGGEVKGMVTSALSCQLEKWEEKTTEFSNQEIT